MSLQKITSSRPFKGMAAFLFGLMILTACQETAQQVVNKPIPAEKNSIAANIDEQAATFKDRAQKGSLTSEEKEMVAAFVEAPATRKLIEINNAATLRLYNAVKAGKGDAIQKAFKEEKEEDALYLLGYSKQEMEQMLTEVQKTQNELLNQMGNSKSLFVSYAKAGASGCKTCGNKEQLYKTIQSMKTADISRILVPAPPANLKVNFDSKATTLQGCSWFEWWNSAAYAYWVVLCYAAFVVCIAIGAVAGGVSGIIIGGPAGAGVGVIMGGIIAFFPCAIGADAAISWGLCEICQECH